jgi:hypothetical protein
VGRVCNGFYADRLVLCPVKWSQGPEFPLSGMVVPAPDIIPGQVDVLPAERSNVG